MFEVIKLTSRPDGSFEELESERKWMPVPRCETCAHWCEFPPHPDTGQRAGQCEKLYIRTDVKEIRGVVHYVKSLLPTSVDFGCVQWKARS